MTDKQLKDTIRTERATPSAERAAEEIILYANHRSGHAEGDEWFNERDMKAVKKIIQRHCSPVPAAHSADQCAWTLDDSNDGEVWETGCGEAFRFTDGGPTDNGFTFCYKCGKRIDAGRYSDDAPDSANAAAQVERAII